MNTIVRQELKHAIGEIATPLHAVYK